MRITHLTARPSIAGFAREGESLCGLPVGYYDGDGMLCRACEQVRFGHLADAHHCRPVRLIDEPTTIAVG